MRWVSVHLQCVDCGDTVSIEPKHPDLPWVEFLGKCKCGTQDLTSYVDSQCISMEPVEP